VLGKPYRKNPERLAALARGDARWTGPPCPAGHRERFATSGDCILCARDCSARRRARLRLEAPPSPRAKPRLKPPRIVKPKPVGRPKSLLPKVKRSHRRQLSAAEIIENRRLAEAAAKARQPLLDFRKHAAGAMAKSFSSPAGIARSEALDALLVAKAEERLAAIRGAAQ
jgi:hypothetical protein